MIPKFLLEFFELVGDTATDLPMDLQAKLLVIHQTFFYDSMNDPYRLGYSNKIPVPTLVPSDLFGSKDYFFDNKMDFMQQIHTFPLSARKLRRKQRFNPRGIFVTHLTTPEHRESHDLLCQANRREDMYRPTSEDFTPSVERETHFLDTSQHEETVTMSSAPLNNNQGSSTPLASSNKSPSSQNSQTFDDLEPILSQTDPSGRSTVVTFTDATTIPMLDDLKLQSITNFSDQCNGSSVRPDQILTRIRPPLKITMTDLLLVDGVPGYTADQNANWQQSISPIEVIQHFINIDVSSGNPDDAVLTVLRNVVIKFDSYDKYCVQETLTSINTHIVCPLEPRLTDNSVNYVIVRNLNDKLKRVKTYSEHFLMKMVNVTPKIATLELSKAKFSEVGNELLRGHASFVSGLPPNRRETENDSHPKGQSGAGGGSGQSNSNRNSNKRQGDFAQAETSKKSETVKCNRCGHSAGPTHTFESCYKKDHAYANSDQPTVPWLQSTKGKAAIADTHTKDGHRPTRVGDIDLNYEASGSKSNSGKGSGHSSGRDNRYQGLCCSYCSDSHFL